MKVKEFLKKRQEEADWLHINGFEFDDPAKNGQFKTIQNLSNHFSLFVDIGANLGTFSQKVKNKKIMMFEPIPHLAKNLRKLGSVYELALGNKKGVTTFNLLYGDLGTSSQFERTYMMPSFTKKSEKIKVKINTFDSYLPEITKDSLGGVFIKIDVEGAELSVLQGGIKILKKLTVPYFVMFEYGFGWKESNSSLKDAFHLLDKIGFSFYRITPLGLEKIRFFTADMESIVFANYLAVKNIDLDKVFKTKHPLETIYGQTVFYEYN